MRDLSKAQQNTLQEQDKPILQMDQFNRQLQFQYLPQKPQHFLPQYHLQNILVWYLQDSDITIGLTL